MRRDNTETELDALQQVGDRLAGFDAQLSAEWLDGVLTALMAGPRVPATPDAGVEAVCGDTWSRTFADPQDIGQAQAALAARWRVLRAQLDPDTLFETPDALHLAPLLLVATDADAQDAADAGVAAPGLGAAWAAGFLQIVHDTTVGWRAELAAGTTPVDQDWRSLLTPMERLAAASLAANDRPPHAASPADAQDAVDAACFAAQDLRLWWIDHAPRTAPRRVAAAPGRNDPCPCGSGRKFKKCHGAAAG
ncbi:MAG: SEC-C metal-binding domain-containing protein [Rubrivivax sp.]